MGNILSVIAPQTQPAILTGIQQLWNANGIVTWLALLGFIFMGVLAGWIAQAILRAAAAKAQSKSWHFQRLLLSSLAGPANLFATAAGLGFGLAMLTMGDDLRAYALRSIGFLNILCVAWAAYNLVSIVAHALERLTAATASKLDDQLVPLVRKALRIFVVVVFALFTAKNVFGADISAWLAGLGIAGLAISLAAQESIKNLFGSVTILLDQPFSLGDTIRFGPHEGTVEEIGFRSTKVRTAEGAMVTVPNSKIADDSVVNVTRRKSIRRQLDIGLPRDTAPEKVREAVNIIQGILKHTEIAAPLAGEPLTPLVAFNDFGPASLNIQVVYWFQPPDGRLWLAHAHAFNLMLLERFNAAGIEFAFPTQRLYLAGDSKRPLAPDKSPATTPPQG